jgi:Rad3-related DNA helicase
MVYYAPQGLMNYQERATTAPKMAEAIERLHAKHQKHTIVHCGAYNIARLIYDCLSDTKNVFLQDQKDREKARIDWMGAKDGIFLSVAFAEGLDLKGPEYPMNIIAKVPFENLSDEFIKYRNNHDNYLRYNTYAAVAVMQSAGRCTRSVDDFSETWILDTSWARFYSRCKSLFQPWFSAALKNGQVEDGQ